MHSHRTQPNTFLQTPSLVSVKSAVGSLAEPTQEASNPATSVDVVVENTKPGSTLPRGTQSRDWARARVFGATSFSPRVEHCAAFESIRDAVDSLNGAGLTHPERGLPQGHLSNYCRFSISFAQRPFFRYLKDAYRGCIHTKRLNLLA